MTMKKIVFIVFLAAILAQPCHAGDEPGPPGRERVRAETRSMVQAGVDEDRAVEIAETMERGRLDGPSRAKVREMVREAVGRGLPLEPMIGKMNEGIAKGVDPHGIVRAVEKVQSRYAFAYRETRGLGFSREKTSQLADAVAQGLAAGMTERDVAAVLRSLREEKTAKREKDRFQVCEETALAIRDMARFGVPSDVVSETVLGALRQGYTAREMETLRSAFMNRARHEQPEAVARQFGEAIGSGARGSQLGGRSASPGDGFGGPGSGAGPGSGSGGPGGSSGSGSSGSGSSGSGSSGSGGSGGSGSGGSGGGGSGGSGGSSGGSGSGGGSSGSGGSGGSGSGGSGSGSGSSGSGGSGGGSGSGGSSGGSGGAGGR